MFKDGKHLVLIPGAFRYSFIHHVGGKILFKELLIMSRESQSV